MNGMGKIRNRLITGMVLLILTIGQGCAQPPARQIIAFPGAEGWGARAIGGRGGKVLFVTSLADDGEGSLRAACRAGEPRTIIFRTGGTIILKKEIRIASPYITIAGQTAPGDGIYLRGAGIRVLTHDVIIRGLRIRVGDAAEGPIPGERDGITIGNRKTAPFNIVIDHCSVSWAIDENISTWQACRNISIQWCIFSEALSNSLHPKGEHSMGMLIGDGARKISVHHNLFAHNRDRNPRIGLKTTVEVINNLVYNWRWFATRTESNADIIGNYYLTGPDWTGGKCITVEDRENIAVFVEGNIGPGKREANGADWVLVNGKKIHRAASPQCVSSSVSQTNAHQAYENVLQNAGAIAPVRDAVDKRIVQSVRSRSGRIIDSPAQVGGWPHLKAGSPPPDRDHDGIPDMWETKHGLNASDPTDANRRRPGGYTNLEIYLNSLFESIQKTGEK